MHPTKKFESSIVDFLTSATTRELTPAEFPLAEQAWTHYRGQKADPEHERIFGVFENGTLAATARCTRHTDDPE